jgi:Protein of unknown function (DUF2905)
MGQLGRVLLGVGLVLVVLGGLLLVGERLGLGRLPGDLVLKRKNVSIYLPIATSILLSLVLTLVLNLWLRRR